MTMEFYECTTCDKYKIPYFFQWDSGIWHSCPLICGTFTLHSKRHENVVSVKDKANNSSFRIYYDSFIAFNNKPSNESRALQTLYKVIKFSIHSWYGPINMVTHGLKVSHKVHFNCIGYEVGILKGCP